MKNLVSFKKCILACLMFAPLMQQAWAADARTERDRRIKQLNTEIDTLEKEDVSLYAKYKELDSPREAKELKKNVGKKILEQREAIAYTKRHIEVKESSISNATYRIKVCLLSLLISSAVTAIFPPAGVTLLPEMLWIIVEVFNLTVVAIEGIIFDTQLRDQRRKLRSLLLLETLLDRFDKLS